MVISSWALLANVAVGKRPKKHHVTNAVGQLPQNFREGDRLSHTPGQFVLVETGATTSLKTIQIVMHRFRRTMATRPAPY